MTTHFLNLNDPARPRGCSDICATRDARGARWLDGLARR
jgi:hypothetical protein